VVSDSDSRLMSGEEIVFRSSKHWVAPVTDSWKALLLIIASLVLAWLQTSDTDGLLGFINRVLGLIETVLLLGGVLLLVYNLFNWRSAKYMVTTQRVLGQEGILRRRETDSLLMAISDVRSKQSFAGRRLGYGEIQIYSASGEAGADTFTSIRMPEEFKKHILEQKVAAVVTTRPELSPDRAGPAPTAAGTDGHTSADGNGTSPKATEVLTTLAVLASLRDSQTITSAEFESKKAELLSRI
jgi:membrane protein YdbS with pleckstrin-like domain